MTPYILARLNQLTSGESLRVNLALVRNNARAGADIAVELAKLRAAQGEAPVTTVPGTAPAAPSAPLVVGGSIFDFVVGLTESVCSVKNTKSCSLVRFFYDSYS